MASSAAAMIRPCRNGVPWGSTWDRYTAPQCASVLAVMELSTCSIAAVHVSNPCELFVCRCAPSQRSAQTCTGCQRPLAASQGPALTCLRFPALMVSLLHSMPRLTAYLALACPSCNVWHIRDGHLSLQAPSRSSAGQGASRSLWRPTQELSSLCAGTTKVLQQGHLPAVTRLCCCAQHTPHSARCTAAVHLLYAGSSPDTRGGCRHSTGHCWGGRTGEGVVSIRHATLYTGHSGHPNLHRSVEPRL